MAIAKDLPETYLCETDADRNRIECYAGQKCIMVNGDIYICITKGTWRKIGDELCSATFMVGENVYERQVYAKGESISAPTAPVVAGSTFNGWKVGENLVEFPYTLNVDTTFVADITVIPPTPTELSVPFEVSVSDFTETTEGYGLYVYDGGADITTDILYIISVYKDGTALVEAPQEFYEEQVEGGTVLAADVIWARIANNADYDGESGEIIAGDKFVILTQMPLNELVEAVDTVKIEYAPEPKNVPFTLSASEYVADTSGASPIMFYTNISGSDIEANKTYIGTITTKAGETETVEFTSVEDSGHIALGFTYSTEAGHLESLAGLVYPNTIYIFNKAKMEEGQVVSADKGLLSYIMLYYDKTAEDFYSLFDKIEVELSSPTVN